MRKFVGTFLLSMVLYLLLFSQAKFLLALLLAWTFLGSLIGIFARGLLGILIYAGIIFLVIYSFTDIYRALVEFRVREWFEVYMIVNSVFLAYWTAVEGNV